MANQTLTFRVFFSSTFGDLRAERDALQENVFRKLRQFCEAHDARFQAIDLRWGISEEAGTEHQTMNICLEELHRCQQTTPRPNFILMLGERYGWRPLPSEVFVDEFEQLLKALGDPSHAEDRARLQAWYQLDKNSVPAEYVLQPRHSEFEDYTRWSGEEATLRAILQQAARQAFDENDPRHDKYFDSATHREIRHGALLAEGAESHVFCYFRNFGTLPDPADPAGRSFIDVAADGSFDREAHDHLNVLKDELRAKFGPVGHVHEYAVRDYREPTADLLDALSADVERNLREVIAKAMKARPEASGAGVENELHADFGAERRAHFVGREDALERIRAYVARDDNRGLVVCGPGGSGKTALMAEAARRMPQWRSFVAVSAGSPPLKAGTTSGVVICRFIGSTPASSDIRLLLNDLCRQIASEYGGDADPIPTDYRELVGEFEKRLRSASAERPLVLILDALDQLNPTEGAHYLGWIPRELPIGVKLVLSVLTSDDETASGDAATSYRAARARATADNVVDLAAMTREQGEELLNAWMVRAGRRLQPWECPQIPPDQHGERRAGRTLTDEQRDDILEKFTRHGLPLWLKLAFEEARQWHSYDGLPTGHDTVPGLSEDVPGILRDLFSRLEDKKHHGCVLTGGALRHLAASRRGLTEDELIDVLSADEFIMDDFIRRSPTEAGKEEQDRLKRLPVLIWSRLYADLEPYLSQRAAFGATVLNFYHRQVGEAVRDRYLTGDARVRTHRQLSGYFEKLEYFRESLDEQRARARRLPLEPRPVNIRKVDELPYHVLEVAKLAGGDNSQAPEWDAVADLLTNWQFLEAKAEARP